MGIRIFGSTCIAMTCILLCVGDDDPLSFLKQYYEENEAGKDTKIPVVDSFERSYDFIIIGSGSGGSTMANRLSEVPEWNVLLLEAGEQENFLTDIPLLTGIAVGSDYDWKYETEKQSGACLSTNGICNWPRGKALGGTSVLNADKYTRGNKRNFDNWAASGNSGWSYKDVLKYFKKSEDLHIDSLMNSTYHGHTGYLSVEYAGFETPLAPLFSEARLDLGYEDNKDYNGRLQTGFSKIQFTYKRGRKCSAAKAYLKPVASRKNLSIATSAFVTKIMINAITKRATAVQFQKNGILHKVNAKKEVILSAGTVGSPQILMLSGIGPRKHLLDMRISIIKALKVGYNLQDHLGIRVRFNLNDSEVTTKESVLRSEHDVSDYFQRGLGPLTLNSEGMAYVHSGLLAHSEAPDIELYMITSMFNGRDLTNYMKKPYRIKEERNYVFIQAIMLAPKSTGTIKLKSKDVEDHPIIEPNYLNSEEDVKVLKVAVKLVSAVDRLYFINL